MTDPTLVPLLRHLELRSTFSPEEVDALLALPFQQSEVPAGNCLIREGDVPETCCALLSGAVFRHKSVGDGARQILAIHFPGDVLGLGVGLLDVPGHGVHTISHSRLAHIPHAAIFDLAGRFPNIARAFWRETLVEVSIARQWIVSLGRGNARKRVAHLICELTARQLVTVSNGATVDWPLTQEQVGDATGLTSVHVNRTMQELRFSGLIRSNKRALTIIDWNGLQAAGEFDRNYLHLPTRARLRSNGLRSAARKSSLPVRKRQSQ